MKVSLDISRLQVGHCYRGSGVYAEQLWQAFQKMQSKDFTVRLIKQGKIAKDVDLIHYPYFDLFFLTLPMRNSKPVIVTIHDVIPLVFPEHFPRGLRGDLKLCFQKRALQNAAAVITDSKSSKKDIVKYLDVPEKKIHVVYLAPNKEFRQLPARDRQLPKNFLLYVGDVNWNKNIIGLIKAFSQLKIKDLYLVLVGSSFQNQSLSETQDIVRLIEELNLGKRVKILGRVAKKDLVAIYNLAKVYVQPSFYEGFGLPVLEAMACGTPVVTANTSSLLEISGNAAVFVNPDNIDSIAKGISKLLNYNNTYYCSQVKKGLEWVKRFSWKKTAQETINVYEQMDF